MIDFNEIKWNQGDLLEYYDIRQQFELGGKWPSWTEMDRSWTDLGHTTKIDMKELLGF